MHQLEALSDRLLREGVAYRHVRRYVRELRDHYDDAVRAEIAKGKTAEAARVTALYRLGSMDDLAREMISKPELRALSARFPRLWGAGGPAAVWLAIMLVVILTVAGVILGCEAAGLSRGGSPQFAPYQMPADIFFFAVTRGAPVLVGAVMLVMAIRQRGGISWVLTGVAALALLAGAADAKLLFSLTPDVKGELSFGFGLSRDVAARAAAMFALMMLPLLFRTRLTPPST